MSINLEFQRKVAKKRTRWFFFQRKVARKELDGFSFLSNWKCPYFVENGKIELNVGIRIVQCRYLKILEYFKTLARCEFGIATVGSVGAEVETSKLKRRWTWNVKRRWNVKMYFSMEIYGWESRKYLCH